MTVIDELEKLVIEYAGPMGKFVVSTQIKTMGEAREKFPEKKLGELIDKVIEAAIYDPGSRKNARKTIRKRLISGNGGV